MTERDALYFGALLHDIGKFAFRAQKTQKGDNHEKLGEDFIRKHLSPCKALEGYIEQIIVAANRKSEDIKKADIATAKERESQSSTETRRPLVSIFSRIAIQHTQDKTIEAPLGIFYHKPTTLEAEVKMPVFEDYRVENWRINEAEVIQWHKEAWGIFLNELIQIQHITDFGVFQSSFFALLQKYTTKVCSAAYKSYPDISLFDHSRIVSALTTCISEADDHNTILLIKGDISGIQSFIYEGIEVKDVSKPAKQLRGRSFFIGLLSEVVANYFLTRLGLYESNILYNGGGHFLLVAPNNQFYKDNLGIIEKEINELLFQRFGGELQMVLAYISKGETALMEDFGQSLGELEEKLARNKKHKSFSIIDTLLANPIPAHRFVKDDAIFEQIGMLLPKANYLLEVKWEKFTHLSSNYTASIIPFKELKTTWVLINSENIEPFLNTLCKVSSVMVYTLNSTDFTAKTFVSNLSFPIGYGFKFIGNHVPMQNDEIKDFEQIAKMENPSYPILAIARMDIDNLGAVFSLGFKDKDIEKSKKSKYTISRIASLSRELHHFFCGHINKIAKEHDIYLAYSGGDDLFAVGALTNILDFSIAVREAFDEFTCSNENFSISCGIIVCKSHYPIHSAARLAGEAEKNAKNRIGKDGVSFMDCVVGWEELKNLRQIANQLSKIIDIETCVVNKEERLPRSFVHTLLEATQRCIGKNGELNLNKIEKTTRFLHYSFARRGVTAQELAEKKLGFKTLLAEYFISQEKSTRKDFYKHFVIPASLVLYQTRETKKQ